MNKIINAGTKKLADLALHYRYSPATHLIVFSDGTFAAELSKLSSDFPFSQDQNGGHISIPKNVVLADPIQLLFFTGVNPDINRVAAGFSPRDTNIIINVGANSQASIIEEHVALGNSNSEHHHHTTTKIKTESAAQVNYYKIQSSSSPTSPFSSHTGHLEIDPGEASTITTHHLLFDTQKNEETISAKLTSPHAKCINKGLYVLGNASQLQLIIDIKHIAPNCESKELFKGIVTDRAAAEFTGKITVHENAKQSTARLDNKNLLLQETARVTTSPALEIYADDVKCSHGATVGQLDEEALWYLQSRGIEKSVATKILINAFMQEIIGALPQPLQEKVAQHYTNY